jgi:hypothetical protein
MQLRFWVLAGVLACGAARSADAAFVTYFGYDEKSGTTPATNFNVNRAVSVNSLAAYEDFIAGMGPFADFGIEDFESFAGAPPADSAGSAISLNLQFDRLSPLTGSLPVNATLTGTGQIAEITDTSATSNGRYPVTVPVGGDQYFDTNFIDLSFTINFGSTPVDAVGFFATDVGDHNGRISLRITYADNTFESHAIVHPYSPTTGYATDEEHGSLIFFGLTSDKAIRSISFTNLQPAQGDRFGFDNLVVGLTAVPEPSSLLLLLSGAFCGGLHVLRRRRVAE